MLARLSSSSALVIPHLAPERHQIAVALIAIIWARRLINT